jgi:uncharacterized protein (TIGR02466 family)
MRFLETGEPVVLGFPTPIFRHRWPEDEAAPVNQALKAEILDRRQRLPSTEVSNVGGWQSEPDLITWDVPELKQFRQWINQAFSAVMASELGTGRFKSRYAVTGWANVNEYGDYNRTHIHPNNHWSGVYYLDIGQPVPSLVPNGAIEFIDPRPACGVIDFPEILLPDTWTIHPETGLMLLFPSWLRHSVLPYFGEGLRITIAFNLRVVELSLDEGNAEKGPHFVEATGES